MECKTSALQRRLGSHLSSLHHGRLLLAGGLRSSDRLRQLRLSARDGGGQLGGLAAAGPLLEQRQRVPRQVQLPAQPALKIASIYVAL